MTEELSNAIWGTTLMLVAIGFIALVAFGDELWGKFAAGLLFLAAVGFFMFGVWYPVVVPGS